METRKKLDLLALSSVPLVMTLGNSMLIPVLPFWFIPFFSVISALLVFFLVKVPKKKENKKTNL